MALQARSLSQYMDGPVLSSGERQAWGEEAVSISIDTGQPGPVTQMFRT